MTANFGGSDLCAFVESLTEKKAKAMHLLERVHYIVAVVALPLATLNGPNCQVRKCPCTHAQAAVSR